MGSFNDNTLRSSAEDERRLKLIRDHGGLSGGLLQRGTDAMSGTASEFNRETKGYVTEHSVFDRSFADIDGIEHRRLDDLTCGRHDISKPPTNFEMNDFRNPILRNHDRKATSFNSELGFNSNCYRGEDDISSHQSLQTNGSSGHPAGQYNIYHEEKIQQDLRLGHSYLSSSREGDLNQHLDSSQYSHPTSWQGWSATSAPNNEHRGNYAKESSNHNHHMPQTYALQHPMQPNNDFPTHGQINDGGPSYEAYISLHDGSRGSVGHQDRLASSQYGLPKSHKQGGYLPISPGSNIISENVSPMQGSRGFNVPPPLPASPPPHSVNPPLPGAHILSSPSKTSSSLFPISVSSAATMPSTHDPLSEPGSLSQPYLHHKSHLHASTGFANEDFSTTNHMSSKKYVGEGQSFALMSLPKPKVVDASHIFKQPHRATRPDHMVIILRGLPGSGKSYLAKMLRDLEVENGSDAPRIHSMDDYFMTEVEKQVDENDVSKSSGSVRGKKPVLKTVMEFCYEPEMEEAYRSSMLKAFKKTLDDGAFSFVIVDDRNLRVADFAQFWATAKRSGYEVYLLEATYKDPAGCAARNVHGFTQEDIQKMAEQWEEAPSLYMKLDIKSLFHGDDLKETGIQEVDMDTDDGDDIIGALSGSERKDTEKIVAPSLVDGSSDGFSENAKKWDAEGDHSSGAVKELGRSKWSSDLDDDKAETTETAKGNLSALSGLLKAYTKEGKSVHWGDQVGNTGFSISAARRLSASLVIGPGAGYNLKSNPLPEDQGPTWSVGESNRQSIFQERLRAERESFRAVFDKRRQRIRGLELDEE
ncbi:hypothetical protein NMG60_11004318 [Bertholletia excelsa]